MAKIYYVVLALKKDEVDEAVTRIKDEKLKRIAEWLEGNKGHLYGDTPEEWTPFKDKTIVEMLETPSKTYVSATSLVDKLAADLSNIEEIFSDSIVLFFLDVFALYSDKYMQLANKVDFDFGRTRKCCLVVPYGLSEEIEEIHDQLFASYRQRWPTVSAKYLKGSLHRIVTRPDELTNLREYLTHLPDEDQPNPIAMQLVTQKFGRPEPKVPRNSVP